MKEYEEVEIREEEKILEPFEVVAIAFHSAQAFLDENPDISPEKKAVVEKILQKEIKDKEEALEKLMKRFKGAVTTAKKIVAWSKDDDYEIELRVKEPTINEKGWIKLSAEDISLSKKEISNLISSATHVYINPKEIELDDEYMIGVELVVEFKI